MLKSPFADVFAQSQVLFDLNRSSAFTMSGPMPSDVFGYVGAAYPGLIPPREQFRPERDELAQVMALLRSRYSRRRLFRIADVADAVATVRRERDECPGTEERPVPMTVRRLNINMNID